MCIGQNLASRGSITVIVGILLGINDTARMLLLCLSVAVTRLPARRRLDGKQMALSESNIKILYLVLLKTHRERNSPFAQKHSFKGLAHARGIIAGRSFFIFLDANNTTKKKVERKENVRSSRLSRRDFFLVVDLLLVDGRLLLFILAPDDVVLLVEVGALVRDGEDLAGVADLFSADAERVARDPDDVELGGDGRVVVGVLFDLGAVHDGIGLGDDAAESGVVGVDVGTQPLGEEVGALVGSRAGQSGVSVVDDGFLGSLLLGADAVVAIFEQQALFLCTDRLGKCLQVGSNGAVEADVVQCREDQHDNHEDQRAKSTAGIHIHIRTTDAVCGSLRRTTAGQGEQANEADFGDVESDKDLLQSAGIDGALSVNIHVVDIEHVVAVGAVEEVQANRGEDEDKRRNSSVADGNDLRYN